MEILYSIWIVILLVSFFGASIFVHELGHFLVARWCGLRVDTFSIGFGPAIWKRRVNGVLYKIGVFPLGGYVALPQLDPTGMSRLQGADGKPTDEVLPAVAVWKKILVSVAGAVGNILFAILIAWVVYLKGVPASPGEISSVVGYVEKGTAAYDAGLRIGDVIQSVDGKTVKTWSDFRLLSALDTRVQLEVLRRDGTTVPMTLPTVKGMLGEQWVDGVEGPSLCMVLSVDDKMSAAEAGVKRGDMIHSLNGQPLYSRGHLQQLVAENPDKPVTLGIKRLTGRTAIDVEKVVTPKFDPEFKMVRIGIGFNVEAVEQGTVIHPLPSAQIKDHSLAIFRFLDALTSPSQAKAAAGAVGGPVAIVFSYWIIFKISIMKALWFTGFLNVNLAILNLLPLPVLDGGHICFALWEGVTGRPLSPRLVSLLVNMFAFLLIGLFLLLTYRDVGRFFF